MNQKKEDLMTTPKRSAQDDEDHHEERSLVEESPNTRAEVVFDTMHFEGGVGIFRVKWLTRFAQRSPFAGGVLLALLLLISLAAFALPLAILLWHDVHVFLALVASCLVWVGTFFLVTRLIDKLVYLPPKQ